MPQSHARSDLLAAIHRRLWRDLGFSEPQPALLPLLPSLLVGWADGQLGEREASRIRSHAEGLSEDLRRWLDKRLKLPPGPYFRYQVLHLLTFMVTTWRNTDAEGHPWVTDGEAWAQELIREQGWVRRLLGRVTAEREELEALHDALHEHEIFACDRIWALARGTHAEGEPQHAAIVHEDHGQHACAHAVVLDGADERVAVGTFGVLVDDEEIGREVIARTLELTRHLHEVERWAAIGELLQSRGRPLTSRQVHELRTAMEERIGCPFEEVDATELGYLEDALASDARWMSWVPGKLAELVITRQRVYRASAPGTFDAPREDIDAHVAQTNLQGPPGLAFRTLVIESGEQTLRLSAPVITAEPLSEEALDWLARLLPATCDPRQQLLLDEGGDAGLHWVADVHSSMPDTPSSAREPLPAGRSLLVPPWIWFRAANALGQRYFSGRRGPLAP